MDERLNKALETANLLRTHQNQKEQLKIRAKQNLLHSTKGGVFEIDSHLITLVKTLIDSGYDEAVIPDRNFNPIKITDVEDFYEDILGRWSEVMNDYFVEYEKLKKSRTVKKVIGAEGGDKEDKQ